MITRNCECCKAEYGTGKFYGDYWCDIGNPHAETKGLCEFCNPNNETWYAIDKKCHKNKINNTIQS